MGNKIVKTQELYSPEILYLIKPYLIITNKKMKKKGKKK